MSLLNGLHEMGKSVAQFAGALGIEQQKADEERAMMSLSDQLLSAREGTARAATQQFQSTEAEKQRSFEGQQLKTRLASEEKRTAESLAVGRYQAIPVQKTDDKGNTISGYLKFNTRTGESEFVEGTIPVPKYNQMTPNQANDNARKDWNYWAKKDKDSGGDGVVYNSDGSVADQFTWITDRAEKYRTGKIGVTGTPSQPNAVPNPASTTQSDDPIARARAAIKQGAPRDAVIKRLRDAGITPPADL